MNATNVIINGRSFIGTTAVFFNVNGLPCTNFTVRLTESERKMLEDLAVKERRTMSNVLRMLMHEGRAALYGGKSMSTKKNKGGDNVAPASKSA